MDIFKCALQHFVGDFARLLYGSVHNLFNVTSRIHRCPQNRMSDARPQHQELHALMFQCPPSLTSFFSFTLFQTCYLYFVTLNHIIYVKLVLVLFLSLDNARDKARHSRGIFRYLTSKRAAGIRDFDLFCTSSKNSGPGYFPPRWTGSRIISPTRWRLLAMKRR